MKKKIEGELISIAHRLLKLKNHTETIQLHEEVKKLYEQLTLLKFYEANTGLVNEVFSESVFEEKVANIVVGTIEVEDEDEEVLLEMAGKDHIAQIEEELFEKNEISHEAFPGNGENELEMAGEEHIEQIKEELFEKIEVSHDAFPEKKVIEEIKEEIVEAKSNKKEIVSNPEIIGTKVSKQISIDDILVHDYKETIFEKKDNPVVETPKEEIVENIITEELKVEEIISEIKEEPLPEQVVFGKAIVLGLNDKIAFEKNLFGGNGDDLSRVLSQLNTFANLDEAKSFVLDFVKPDYNNWQGKEEFEKMFLEIVENKFK